MSLQTSQKPTWIRWRLAAALTVLVVTGCGRSESEVDDSTKAVAARFLDELRAGQWTTAWHSSSTEFKSLMGVENLKDYVKTHPALKVPAEFAEIRTIDRDGRGMAECIFHATPKVRGKPVPSTIKVLLAAGEDGWKVEHLAVDRD